MHVLLLTKYLFLLVFLVVYTESQIVIPTMEPNVSSIFIRYREKLSIECSSTRQIKFFVKPVDKNVFNESRINIFSEKKENGIYTMRIQINEPLPNDIGLYGCGHNKRDDEDVRWIQVQDDITLPGSDIPSTSYIKVKKNDPFQITCSGKRKITFYRYISPWLCCILPIEDEPNKTKTLMTYEKQLKTRGVHCSISCERYKDDFMNAKISQDEVNGTFISNLEKKKAVHGDTGWYGCDSFKMNIIFLIQWTYVYVEPEKYLFVDINDFKAIKVDVNKTLTIPCRPKSPNYQVTLWANKTIINDNDNVIFNNSIGFIIKNVQLKDKGYYECKITLDGITEEKGFDVLVTEPNNLRPTMYPDLSYIELEENQKFKLTCTSKQTTTHFFISEVFVDGDKIWNWKILVLRPFTEVNGSVHRPKLILNTSPRKTGFYGCYNVENPRAPIIKLSDMNIRWIYIYIKAKPRIKKLRINKYYYGQKEIAEIENIGEAFPSSNIRSTIEESNPHLEIRNMTNIVSYVDQSSSLKFMVTTAVSLSWTPARNITFTYINDVGNDSIVVPLFSNVKPPEFGISGPKKKLAVGDSLELMLMCIGSLTSSSHRMKWIKNYADEFNSEIYEKYDPRTNIKLLEYDDICISILTISSVEKSDENKYYCKVRDTVYDYMVYVNELKKPNCNHTNMNETEVKYETRGKSTVLTCNVDGVPKPIITWSKDNVQINMTYPNMPNDTCKYEFYNNNYQELHIGYLDENCFGNYSCKADNYLGHWETYQQIIMDDPTIRNIIAFGIISALIITTIILIYFFIKFKKEKNLRIQLMEGTSKLLNPELTVNEQVHVLGYDKKWEFSRDKLKLGKELGNGHFGIVKKAEAYGIYSDETITAVAVKIAKKCPGITNIQVLANELKIMSYIGEHRNIVNLLGACTKNITNHELLVIVEYCHIGDLHDYLIKHRLKFINQINPLTGKINIIPIGFETLTALANVKNDNNKKNEINCTALSVSGSRSSNLSGINDKDSIEMSNNIAFNKPALYPEDCLDDYNNKDENLQTICTQDLFSWSLQVAQGMEYLSNKKVLHGDLAARNILLAQNNVVKISDFGLAKNVYTDGIYEKKGNGPLPFKWIAIDSLKDEIFTTQSDVWSFGIVLWELFSLAKTPYAGMDLDEYCLKVFNGYRMKKPEYATNEIYNIMRKCWLENPTLRPTFTDLVNDIGDLYNNIDKKDSTDSNTPFVDIKNRLDDGANNDSLIMNPVPDNPALSSSKNEYIDHSIQSISIQTHCMSL